MSMTGATMVIPMVAVGSILMTIDSATTETAKPAHEPASVTLEYEVTRKEDNGVVLSGRTSVDATHEAAVAHDARDHEELRFAARERGDGTFDVGVRYREVAPDGTSIRWEPTLRVARGATASVDVAGSGWSRGLRVKLD